MADRGNSQGRAQLVKFEQAVSNKKGISLNLPFPLTYFGFTGFIAGLPWARTPFLPGTVSWIPWYFVSGVWINSGVKS